ncbi:MAG: hypothetical protein BWY15_00086 [Firmicutes bacterium ADurb.Bin193]|nr:MAG: hypothetical protein BWY15_00086 [Firmicutes bacterium ADurb.Bin193]
MRGRNNLLEDIRKRYGTEECINTFREMCKTQKDRAVALINDARLGFATLYILIPVIKEFDLSEHLSPKNNRAVTICESIKKRKEPTLADIEGTLEWILTSGSEDDGLCDEFDTIIDDAASLLINKFHNSKILPTVAKIIFSRNAKGGYIHDLVWVFFRSRNIEALVITAGYLLSKNEKNVRLARELLNIHEDVSGKKAEYKKMFQWIKENYPYIRFTGENFLYSSRPNPFDIDVKSKYLCKSDIAKTDQIPEFDSLDKEAQTTLADFSGRLFKRSRTDWEKFMKQPIEAQLEEARRYLR